MRSAHRVSLVDGLETNILRVSPVIEDRNLTRGNSVKGRKFFAGPIRHQEQSRILIWWFHSRDIVITFYTTGIKGRVITWCTRGVKRVFYLVKCLLNSIDEWFDNIGSDSRFSNFVGVLLAVEGYNCSGSGIS